MRRILLVLALSVLPATTVSAQRLVNERAGFAQPTALVSRIDTTSSDATDHGHARLEHALIGGGVGLLLGMWIGNEQDRARQRRCPSGADLCHVEGVGGAVGAVVGLAAGTIAGALWPVH